MPKGVEKGGYCMEIGEELQLRPEIYLVSDTYRECSLIPVNKGETYIYLNGTFDSYSDAALVKKIGEYWNEAIKTPYGIETYKFHWLGDALDYAYDLMMYHEKRDS